MAKTKLDDVFERAIAESAARIAPLGFRRSGTTIRLLQGGNAGLIQFQRSASNTAERLSFTINLAVVCGALLDGMELKKAKEYDAHLRQRIGHLLPSREDKWWTITSVAGADTMVADVAHVVETIAAQFVISHMSNDALIALWRSGQSPGLTEKQRLWYLGDLTAPEARNP